MLILLKDILLLIICSCGPHICITNVKYKIMSHVTLSTKMILGNNRHLVGKVSSASGVSEAPHPVAVRRAGQRHLTRLFTFALGFSF